MYNSNSNSYIKVTLPNLYKMGGGKKKDYQEFIKEREIRTSRGWGGGLSKDLFIF